MAIEEGKSLITLELDTSNEKYNALEYIENDLQPSVVRYEIVPAIADIDARIEEINAQVSELNIDIDNMDNIDSTDKTKDFIKYFAQFHVNMRNILRSLDLSKYGASKIDLTENYTYIISHKSFFIHTL